MDYKDYQIGMPKDHFWLQGKKQLIDILLSKQASNKKLKILDIGAGTGQDLEILNKFGEVHVVDIEQKVLDLIPDNFVFRKKLANACDIPYEENYFDLVVSFDVLEHIKDHEKAIQEFYRILKPDGLFIFTVPAFNFLYSRHDKELGHFRRYNKKKLKNLLCKYFEQKKLSFWLFFLFLPASIQRLFNLNIVKSGKKIPKFINFIFLKILNIENWLINKNLTFPFGLSIYGIYKAKK